MVGLGHAQRTWRFLLKEFRGEGKPRDRMAAGEGRGLGNRAFFPRSGAMGVSVNQGLGPSGREEKLSFPGTQERQEVGAWAGSPKGAALTVTRFILCHTPQWSLMSIRMSLGHRGFPQYLLSLQ